MTIIPAVLFRSDS